MALILRAPAKINLFLKVQNRRPDGYHNILSLMQMVGLYDILTFQEEGAHIRLNIVKGSVPKDGSNLVLRAARMLQKHIESTQKISRGVIITLEKNIPVSAGLGGGSADAAATLMGLNHLWSLGLSRSRLAKLAGYVGSDVPFFFYGPIAWVFGKGDHVKKEASVLRGFIVLVFSGVPVSTAEVFHRIGEEINLTKRGDTLNIGKSTRAMPKVQELLNHAQNDLERVTLKAQPNLIKVKELLESFGGRGALMSGSGPSVFARYESEEQANNAADAMRAEGHKNVWVAKLLTRAPSGFGGWGSPCFSDSI